MCSQKLQVQVPRTAPTVAIEPLAVDIATAATVLAVSQKYVRRLLSRRLLVPIRLDHARKLVIAVSDLKAFVARQRDAA